MGIEAVPRGTAVAGGTGVVEAAIAQTALGRWVHRRRSSVAARRRTRAGVETIGVVHKPGVALSTCGTGEASQARALTRKDPIHCRGVIVATHVDHATAVDARGPVDVTNSAFFASLADVALGANASAVVVSRAVDGGADPVTTDCGVDARIRAAWVATVPGVALVASGARVIGNTLANTIPGRPFHSDSSTSAA